MNGDPWWTKYALLFGGWLLGLFTKELSERITFWVRGPKLKADFGDTEDCVTLTPEEYVVQTGASTVATRAGQRVVMYARVRVTNTKPRIAQRVRAWLVNIEEQVDGEFRPTIFRDSMPLIWSYNAEIDAADLPQSINRYVDVVRVQSDQPGYEPCLRAHDGTVLKPLRFAPLFARNGVFRLTVLVSAQDTAPQQIRLILSMDGNWPPKVHKSA